MNQRKPISPVVLSLAGILLSGCHGDPTIRVKRYLESGRRYSAEGRYKEASIQFLNALRVDEDIAEAHYGLAQSYEHLGQFGAASEELERTLDVEPDNYRARIEFGNLLFATGRDQEALLQAKTVLADQPQVPEGHALRSSIAAALGDRDKALSEIERAVQLDPKRAEFHESLALLLAGDRESASRVEAELKKAIELEPESANPRLLLAGFYGRTNRLLEAEQTAWEAVRLDPGNLTARANVAEIILQEGDAPRAELVLRQASMAKDNLQAQRLLADYYAATDQLDKAGAEFATLVAKYPRDASLQKAYVRVLLEAHQYSAAKAVLSDVLKRNIKDPEAAALNAVLLFNAGNANDALNVLRESARMFPQDAFLHDWLGEAALASGDINLAETSFRQAVYLNPAEHEAQQELARIATERGDMSMLGEVAEETISASPRYPDGYVWRAVVEMSHGQLSQAERDLSRAIQDSPQCWEAYLQLGKLRLQQKRFAESSALLEQVLAYNPGSAEALRLLAGCYLYENRLGQAVERVKAQIAKSPQNSSFYDLLAELQIQNKDLDRAVATVRKAIQLNTADGEAVMLFAQVASQRGLTSNAIEAWRKWSADHPNDAGALAILGTLEESRGAVDRAEADYRKSLEIEPRQPIAANNLAYRMLLDGETPDDALKLAETARQGMPDSPNTADTLAWTYYCKGAYQLARGLLEEAVRTEPDSATMHYHLGMVYSKLNDKSNASIHLKKALSLPHDAQVANDARVALQGIG